MESITEGNFKDFEFYGVSLGRDFVPFSEKVTCNTEFNFRNKYQNKFFEFKIGNSKMQTSRQKIDTAKLEKLDCTSSIDLHMNLCCVYEIVDMPERYLALSQVMLSRLC